MNVGETCQTIKSLIKEILKLDKEYQEGTPTYRNKSREAFLALQGFLEENLKEVMPVYSKYNKNFVISIDQNGKRWEFSLSEEQGWEISKKPETVNGNYPIEELANRVRMTLQNTLNDIKDKKRRQDKQIEELDQAIAQVRNLQSN
ncbi:hypothetical protein [Geitlerinema sp. PCC 9228]|uniref:hypothetical protein n=1 Tax=Geitlerinema sp. PCC 9228 TaxID=111611 RepID=UPI0008F9BD4F|nr:hypothetical protein [Geitlerinema sp. PCC 9228]